MATDNSLTNRTSVAFSWRFTSSVVVFGLEFVVSVVLARLLPVEAFGILGMAMIFVGLTNLVSEVGMTPALVQCANLTETHIRVGFTVSGLMGLSLIVLMNLVAAPVAGVFFHQAMLIPVLRLLSVTLPLRSLAAPADALLQRKLAFRQLFWIDTLSYAFGYALVGVVLAALGQGVWSLAWAAVAQTFLRTTALLIVVPFAKRFSLARAELRQLIHFGVGTTMARIANYAARNGDYLVIGRWLGAEPLGIYSRAYQLMTVPTSYFASVISTVLFPAYAEIQSAPVRLKSAYLRSVTVVGLVTIPVLAGMCIAAPELILGIYGSKWAGATVAFQILCVGGIARALYNLGDSLARARGATYAQARRHTIYALAVFGGAILGSRWGIEGVAIGVVAALFLMLGLMVQLANTLIEISWLSFVRAQGPGMVVGSFVVAVAIPMRLALIRIGLPPIVTAALLAGACGAIWLIAVVSFPKQLLGDIHSLLLSKLARVKKGNSLKL